MKKTFLIIASLALITTIFLQIQVPIKTYAQSVDTGGANSVDTPSSGKAIANPLKVSSIQDFINAALQFVVEILAIAAVCYIMWAGFLFVKAQGNPEELKTAKQALMHALIGTAIVLGAWGLAMVIANTVNKITNNNDVTLKGPIKL